MVSFTPDPARFARFAARERLLPPGDDTGYAWHAVLAAAFGPLAPKPFAWMPPRTREGGSQGRLLGYTGHHLDALRAQATAFADPVVLEVLRLEDAAVKVMPSGYHTGQSFGFRVRVRPTVRTGASRDGQRARERDAYDPAGTLDRASTYAHWLANALVRSGAELLEARAEALRLSCLLTRSRHGAQAIRASTLGPDATFSGTLRVTHPEAFASLMARGVGRHRAFGFGMLLLRPR
jgi:CRISPR system Cascade subunit CasE